MMWPTASAVRAGCLLAGQPHGRPLPKASSVERWMSSSLPRRARQPGQGAAALLQHRRLPTLRAGWSAVRTRRRSLQAGEPHSEQRTVPRRCAGHASVVARSLRTATPEATPVDALADTGSLVVCSPFAALDLHARRSVQHDPPAACS